MSGISLDPFGYWPAQRSRIRGLGGAEKSVDPNYVFHSPYVPLDAGPSLATISFDAMRAETGMIAVRIFQHLEGGTPAVTEQGRITALLPSLAKTGRPIKIPFTALPGAQYAVTGYVFGDCSAQARSIGVEITPRTADSDDPSRVRSIFGRLSARRAASLASSEAPTMAWPVSQGLTQSQMHEADFVRLSSTLTEANPTLVELWEPAYIIRVLEVFGRMEQGARGLSFASGADHAALFAQRAGCDVTTVAAAMAGNEVDGVGISAGLAENAFDFAWMRSDVLTDAAYARVLGAIEGLLDRLRPGGLAIQMIRLSDTLDRHAINRIALGTAALGHIVAQVRHVPDAVAGTPFGFVIRKSTDDLIAGS
jgi:hypothetical protein